MIRISAFFFLSIPLVANAHHSIAAFYEPDASGEVAGTITEVNWVNPHISFTVESINDNNEVETWTIESGAANGMTRNGITRDVLEVGSDVTVVGRPSSRGQMALYASSVRRADGESVALRGVGSRPDLLQASAGPEPEGIFRVWSRGRAYGDHVNDSATGFELPYTPAAQSARESYDPVTDDTALKCIQQGMPGIMDNPYPIEFVAAGDDIELRVEEWSVVRTIHMADYDDPGSQVFTRQGYSVGRWDGDTLVVQTSKVDWPFFDDVGTPQSMDVDIVERFALSPDASRLDYEITVTDPATFTETISLDGYWTWVPGEEVKTYQCTPWF